MTDERTVKDCGCDPSVDRMCLQHVQALPLREYMARQFAARRKAATAKKPRRAS